MHGWRSIVVVLAFAAVGVLHASGELRVWLGGPDSSAMADFRQSLQQQGAGQLSFMPSAEAAAVQVLVGEAAFQKRNDAVPAIGVQVERSLMDAQVALGCRCSGLYAGPDPVDQLRLLLHLLPNSRRVGVLLSPEQNYLQALLKPVAAKAGIQLVYETARHQDDIARALSRLLPDVDALLLFPDAELFNADTARMLILTSYRQGRPVIGPNAQFVSAGSLASVYASTGDSLEEVLQMLKAVSGGASLPSPRYAAHSIAINEHVARAYGVSRPDAGDLEAQLWGGRK